MILFGILYPSWYCPLRTGDGFFLLNRENPLSLTKVICWQSLLLFNSHLIYACQVWGKKTVIKPCVHYFLSNFYFFTKWYIALEKLWKMFFISCKKLSLFLRYSNFCIFFSLPFHSFQIQKDKWKWNNLLWCYQLTCINLRT